jgi:ABC-type transport system substrate-binding protein
LALVPRRLLITLLLPLVLLVGCGGDDGEDASDTSLIPPETTEATTTTMSTTSTTTAPTTTAPSTPTAYSATARDAVNELEAAWQTGDQARARAIAPGDVVDALFLVPPDGFEIYGCDSGEFETSGCNFRNRATEAFIQVTAQRSDAGWQISTIDVNED